MALDPMTHFFCDLCHKGIPDEDPCYFYHSDAPRWMLFVCKTCHLPVFEAQGLEGAPESFEISMFTPKS